ncbi:MAG: hypothetical protein HAW63_04160 [Bdellovibrionaceae bacterium]|nr:hypothetical protein [Pseudobdellovibrionaceae bacterium]
MKELSKKVVSKKWLLLSIIFLWSTSSFAANLVSEEKLSPHYSKGSYSKKIWHWSFYSLASQSSVSLKDGYGGLFSYNYFKARHYLGNTASISLVPTFYISTAGRRDETSRVKDGSIQIGDFYSEYQYSAYSNAFLKTKMGARLYLPLSGSSKRSLLRTRSQLYASVSAYPFYKVQTYYKVEADGYLYKQNSYKNKDKQEVGKKTSKWSHFLSVSYLATSKFHFSGRVGQELSLYKKTPMTEPNQLSYSADMSVQWNMAYKMNMNIGLQNTINRGQSWKDLLALKTSEIVVRTSILF